MVRIGVAWNAAILVGRRSRFLVRGLWLRAASDDRLREVVLLDERSSVVRAIDAISAIEALSRIAEWDAVWIKLCYGISSSDAEGGRSRGSCQHARIREHSQSSILPAKLTQRSTQTTPTILLRHSPSPLPQWLRG